MYMCQAFILLFHPLYPLDHGQVPVHVNKYWLPETDHWSI